MASNFEELTVRIDTLSGRRINRSGNRETFEDYKARVNERLRLVKARWEMLPIAVRMSIAKQLDAAHGRAKEKKTAG